MCGIIGVFNFRNCEPIDRAKLKESTNLMQHRGPDAEGYYYDDQNGIGFGQRRLSIIDLVTGDQPISNENKSVWINYNGELYNYKELRNYLLNKGHIFKTQSDTEVIVHAYEEFGFDCVKKFNGIFAFSIWDSNKKLIFLTRDHFGVKPVYYYQDSEKFIFASEYKSILNYANPVKEIDIEALNKCLIYRHTPAPDTLIKSIKKLPASHYLIFESSGNYKLINYWNKHITTDYSKTKEYWQEKLKDQIESAVKRQMISDVPIGLSLSGGVDSALILALMTKFTRMNVHTFTVGFEGGRGKDNEIEKARELSNTFGADFHSYDILESDYLNFFDKYLYHLEEPVGNESAAAYYFVANLAKGNVKVLLNWQGADEPFAGYDRYIGLYYSEKYPKLLKMLSSVLYKVNPFVRRKMQFEKLHDHFKINNTNEKIFSASTVLNRKIKEAFFADTIFNSNNINILEDVSKIIDNKISGNVLEKLLFYDMFSSLPENLLLCEDKMAMAASIEARVPFLDIDLVETVLSIPVKYKVRMFTGKMIHKEVSEKYLPKKYVYQRKIGYDCPVADWLRNSLGEMLMDYINSKNSITNQYLNVKSVNSIINEHRLSKANNEKFLFLLLSIEKWNSIFIK